MIIILITKHDLLQSSIQTLYNTNTRTTFKKPIITKQKSSNINSTEKGNIHSPEEKISEMQREEDEE